MRFGAADDFNSAGAELRDHLAKIVDPVVDHEGGVTRAEPLSCYSSLSTTFGSSRDAPHAGSQMATTATAVIVAITKAIVTISVGCTPNSRDAISRFTTSAPARPMAAPIAVT